LHSFIPYSLFYNKSVAQLCNNLITNNSTFVTLRNGTAGEIVYNAAMSELSHILIVDDDEAIRSLLADFLSHYQFEVTTAGDGKGLFTALGEHSFDLIILDVMLPGEDGLSLCQRIRQHSNIPIIMLTAIGEEADRIVGLEMGADDYVAKPFNPRELLARIKAVLRRSYDAGESQAELPIYSFLNWKLDTTCRRLFSPDDVEVSLTSGEYDLLVAFLENPQQVLSRDQLLDITKNRLAGPFDRSIDVQISRLRHKIEIDPKNPTTIKTVRGGGYLFTPRVLTR